MNVAASAGARPGDGAQARVLAELLRGSRVTLLLGTRHAQTHWAQGLMRQLRRRAADRGRDEPVVLPFEDRRKRRVGPIARCDAEVVVFVDDWGGDPLAGLRESLERALAVAGWSGASTVGPLADTLAGLNQQLGARFLFVFDRFEDFLQTDAQRGDVRAFVEQWQRTLDDLTVAAHFIVGLSDDAEHLLVRLRERLPKIERHWVRLEPREPGISAAGEGMPTASNDSTLGEASDAPPSPPPPFVEVMSDDEWRDWIRASLARVTAAARVAASAPARSHDGAPMRLDEVYASVERTLAHIAQQRRGVTWPPAPAPAEVPVVAAAPAAVPVAIAAKARPWQPRRLGTMLAAVALLALAAWLAAALLAPRAPLRDASLPAAEPLTTARLAPPSPSRAAELTALPLGRIVLRVDAEAQRGIGAELAEQVGAAAQVAVETLPVLGESTDPAALPADALALARYDALQAARREAPNGALRIVAPLFTEELHFLVRADSPLRRIHEIRASRINVGPVGSARETTASSSYAGLFGAALPARQADHAGLDDALPALLDGRIDVLVMVAGQPSDWLASLPPDSRSMLRPLALDPRDVRSRRALERYLPATLRADRHPGWLHDGVPTLAVMAFLVAPQLGDGAGAGRLEDVVRALCVQLPALQRSGHPKWREVQPGLQLNVGWPAAGLAADAWRRCPPAGVASTSETAGTAPVSSSRPEGATR